MSRLVGRRGERRGGRWPRIVVGVVVGVVVLLGAATWWGYLRSPTLADLRVTADQLVVPAAWAPAKGSEHRRAPVCIAVDCPSVVRQWLAAEPLDLVVIHSLFRAAGWELVEASDDCSLDQTSSGAYGYCVVTGRTGGLAVRLQSTEENADQMATQHRITLLVTT